MIAEVTGACPMLGFEYWAGDLELDSVLAGGPAWGAEGHGDAFPAD